MDVQMCSMWTEICETTGLACPHMCIQPDGKHPLSPGEPYCALKQ